MLRERGHQAYLAGDYDVAIELWQRVGQQIKKMQPRRIFAEAYFRRGVERIHRQEAVAEGVEDLREALAMYPQTPRYTYHLGLGMHLQGDYEAAIRIYREIYKKAPDFADRVAYPLALALMQHGADPDADPIWDALSAQEHAMLCDVQTFRRRPYQLSEDAPPLWRGVVALDQGALDDATALLQEALEGNSAPDAVALVHYYLGNIAAQREAMDTARHHWMEAEKLGMKSPSLIHNLGESFYRLAETCLEHEDIAGALDAVRAARRYEIDTPSFTELRAQIYYHLGYQAARQGDWALAEEYWQQAYDLEDGSFRAAYNLALAYERAHDYHLAAEMWREVLRRRPRKEDHRDAISDEEVAQLWKRAAQAYIQVGEYDEAVHVYRMAVKWNPENLDTRMEMVRSMLDNGQWQAAENELERILDRNPDYIPALIRMGEVQSARGWWWQRRDPTHYWKRALALEPNNLEAQQILIDYYLNQAEDGMRWGDMDRVYDLLQEVLEYQPKNVEALELLAICHVSWGEMDAVQECVDDILNRPHTTLKEYTIGINIWLAAEQLDKVLETIAQAKRKSVKIPASTYISVGMYCLEAKQFSEDESIALAREWFDRALENSAPDENTLLQVGERLAQSTQYFDLAESYLKRALEAGQEPGYAYMVLTILYIRKDDRRQARRYLRKAESLARREKDSNLIDVTRSLRDLLTMPPDFLDMLFSGALPFGPGIPSLFDDF